MRTALSIAAADHLIAPFREFAIYLRSDEEMMLAAANAVDTPVGHDFIDELCAALKAPSDSTDALDKLSQRELEVFGALCRHESNKAIGRRLGVSEHAVKFHVKNIFRKLGVHSREEAIGALARLQN